MPVVPNEPSSSQTISLSTQRQMSSIPMAASDSVPMHQGSTAHNVWVYPSEQQFFNAMKRKVWHVTAILVVRLPYIQPACCCSARYSTHITGQGVICSMQHDHIGVSACTMDVQSAGVHVACCSTQPWDIHNCLGLLLSKQSMSAVHILQGWDPSAQDMHTVVSIHNTVNEQVWQHILAWEMLHACDCAQPKLKKFQGRPNEYSPKARLLNFLVRHHASPTRDYWCTVGLRLLLGWI